VVEVHAAEALLIVDGHSHLLKMIDINCDNGVLIPRKNRGSSFKNLWTSCKIPWKDVSGLASERVRRIWRDDQFRVLTGGISVLMCLSVGKGKGRIQVSGWSPERLEVVPSVNDYDSSDGNSEEDRA
jgi:hypothetical protein